MMELTTDKLANLLNLVIKERKSELKNQAKENWLIAWSSIRSLRTCNTYRTRMSKKIERFLVLAEKCYCTREEESEVSYKERLELHVRNNGFQKQWTGWKYTWVKIEENDVPF